MNLPMAAQEGPGLAARAADAVMHPNKAMAVLEVTAALGAFAAVERALPDAPAITQVATANAQEAGSAAGDGQEVFGADDRIMCETTSLPRSLRYTAEPTYSGLTGKLRRVVFTAPAQFSNKCVTNSLAPQTPFKRYGRAFWGTMQAKRGKSGSYMDTTVRKDKQDPGPPVTERKPLDRLGLTDSPDHMFSSGDLTTILSGGEVIKACAQGARRIRLQGLGLVKDPTTGDGNKRTYSSPSVACKVPLKVQRRR